MANPYQNIPGGLLGQQQQYYYGPTPPEPDYRAQCWHLQQHVITLQQRVMELQAELMKVIKVKEWLTGPETPGTDSQTLVP